MSNILISPPPTTLLTGLLQLDGGVAISSTPVYVADQTNTDSKLALSTTSVNVNTLTGSALVNIKGTGTTSSSSSLIVQNSAGTNVIQALDNTNVYFAKAIRLGGTSIYDVSGYMSMFNSGNSARIGPEHFSTDSSSWYADASGSRITLSYLGYGLINNNWLVGSGASNTARLSVKGSGSTSATTSLLVQNSSGNDAFKITDDKNANLLGRASVGVTLNPNIWATYNSVLQVGQIFMYDYSPTPQSVYANNNYFDGTSAKYFRTGGASAINFTNDGSTQIDTFVSGTAGNSLPTPKSYYFGSNGNMGINTTSPTSRLHIVGSGTTSATSNLLLQNSSATQLIKVTDDGKMTMGTGTTGTALLDIAVGSGSTPPLRLKGYSDAGTSYLLSGGTESYQDGFKIKMVNGNVTMGTQLNGYTFGLETFNGTAMTIANAGNIGVGTTTPNVSAKLEVNSTTQGFLPPVMTTAQKTGIGSPSKGLIVFDSSLNKLCVYSGTAWETITSV